MRPSRIVFAMAVVMLAAGSGPAFAFTQEPIRGLEPQRGNQFADPDRNRQPLAAPGAPARSSDGSPFSLSITGPGDSDGPNVNRPSDDNRHLYWNNTSNRHDMFDRESLRRRQYR